MLAVHHQSAPCEFMIGRTFCDLKSLMDRSHSFLEELEHTPYASDGTSFLHARLVIHEWLANLVQYADFRGRTPLITIRVQFESDRIRYAIEDNSAGFDFDARMHAQRKSLTAMPNRGMGLLMIAACTDELIYRRVNPDRHRLEFVVSAHREPRLNVPLRAAC